MLSPCSDVARRIISGEINKKKVLNEVIGRNLWQEKKRDISLLKVILYSGNHKLMSGLLLKNWYDQGYSEIFV